MPIRQDFSADLSANRNQRVNNCFLSKIENRQLSSSVIVAGHVFQQAHVVAAFEQSLSNMTQRLQQLTNNSQQKV